MSDIRKIKTKECQEVKKFFLSVMFAVGFIIFLGEEVEAAEVEAEAATEAEVTNENVQILFGVIDKIKEMNAETESVADYDEEFLSAYLKWHQSLQQPFITVGEFRTLIGIESDDDATTESDDEILTKKYVAELLQKYFPDLNPNVYFYGMDVSDTDNVFHLIYLEGVIRNIICTHYIEEDAVTYYEARLIAYAFQMLNSASV